MVAIEDKFEKVNIEVGSKECRTMKKFVNKKVKKHAADWSR